ncbi:efflux transporter outer membrane subunit [Pandoraea terrigena]|uniref:RND transporter n=1 Tax=Pandoraea terrigena TaxID=2508292 RepID=A0A5E4XP11_9BURK|nr:efflux transporter outer membrane subunit [Pandoraea terrigena]VVE38117.1 RND transporter [Pandoraea terrigena]
MNMMRSSRQAVLPVALRRGVLACAVAILSVGLAGCGSLVAQPYQAPDVAMPGQWQQGTPADPNASPTATPVVPEAGSVPAAGVSAANAPPTSVADVLAGGGDGWWRRFNDDGLNRMIDKVLARNGDLAAAAIAVRAAQLSADLTHSNELPTLTGEYDGAKAKSLRGYGTTTSHALTGTVSYEADLWGKLARLTDAARWEALATQQDLATTRLSLIGTATNLYWKLAYLNERIDSEQKSVAYLEKVLALVRVQRDAGATSTLEVLEAEQSIESERSTLTQLLAQRVATRMSLAALLADPAGARVPAPPNLFTLRTPVIDAGVPLEVLARRPDLRAAELRLREQFANVNATRASYYPTLSLTGALGSSSTALVDLLKNPVGTLGATIALPFLNWHQRDLNIKSSQATYDRAVQTFRQTLYAALTDVETALSARTQYLQQGEQLARSLAAARAVERIYAVRYRTGAVTLRVWLDAQESVRSAERTLAENRYNQLTETVTLYQALGGDVVTGASQASLALPVTTAEAAM